MFMTDGQSNYDIVCADLFAMARDIGAIANLSFLGGHIRKDRASIAIFDEEWCVRGDGVYKDGRRLDTTGSILVARYMLQAGTEGIKGAWLPYRDLKDGAQFASFIKTHLEDRIAHAFSGRTSALKERIAALIAEGRSPSPSLLNASPGDRVARAR